MDDALKRMIQSIKFNAMFSQQAKNPTADVEHDPTYISARADLLKLITSIKPRKRYGPRSPAR